MAQALVTLWQRRADRLDFHRCISVGDRRDRSAKSAEINVETFKGVVQLSGFVSSQDAVNKAVAVTRNVGGVKSVKYDLRLK